MCVHISMCIHNFGAGTALRSVPANHVVGYSLGWPSISLFSGPNCHKSRDLASKISKKNFRGDTSRPPQQERAIPSRTHLQHDYTSCAGAQVPPLLGPRSQKPFPQIKIYHYTPVINIYTDRHTPTPTNRPRYSVAVGRIPCCACDAVWLHQVDKTQKSSLL